MKEQVTIKLALSSKESCMCEKYFESYKKVKLLATSISAFE